MSYDLHCYKPTSDHPCVEEAEAFIEGFEARASRPDPAADEMMERLARSLMAHNPRLRRSDPDWEEISRTKGISLDEARRTRNHIELYSPQGDNAIDFLIGRGEVSIGIPFWYEDERSKALFRELSDYLRVIKRTAGYFVYDSQTGLAFDPEK